MISWWDEQHDAEWEFEAPDLTFEVTDNPVVAELLGPDGQVLRQWTERPPFGFRR